MVNKATYLLTYLSLQSVDAYGHPLRFCF